MEAVSVATDIEQLGATTSKPTVKQHAAAIHQIFDYLTTGILKVNPAASVLIGQRNRALIETTVYSFARVGAAVTMKVGDYLQHRKLEDRAQRLLRAK
jgi:hypothetical protein